MIGEFLIPNNQAIEEGNFDVLIMLCYNHHLLFVLIIELSRQDSHCLAYLKFSYHQYPVS